MKGTHNNNLLFIYNYLCLMQLYLRQLVINIDWSMQNSQMMKTFQTEYITNSN